MLFVAYAGIGVKLLVLGLSHDPPQTLKSAADEAVSGARPDLLDRNGEVLATDVKTMSVFAEPRRIIDKDEAVELITAVLARRRREANCASGLARRRASSGSSARSRRRSRQEIFHLGLPGVGFVPENKRVYPNGPIGAHVLGYVDKDNIGIAGMEKYLDEQSLTDPHVPGFAVDPGKPEAGRACRSISRRRMRCATNSSHGMERFRAKAAAGAILDVNTGEVIALESLPDYDPNNPDRRAQDPTKINRINVGVYEMGSTFKALSIAMALEFRQGQSRHAYRRARQPALRPLHHPRFPRHAIAC